MSDKGCVNEEERLSSLLKTEGCQNRSDVLVVLNS